MKKKFTIDDEIKATKSQLVELSKEELEARIKLRNLGNISLIAALYKVKFLPEKVVHQYCHSTIGEEYNQEQARR